MQSIQHILASYDFETTIILKELNLANRYLAELKGLCQSMPNPAILINSLGIQEAQDSSEIENIITTQDEIFKYQLLPNKTSLAAKEVDNYTQALDYCQTCLTDYNIISLNTIIRAQQIIKNNAAGIRVQSGTVLKNVKNNQVIYTPPEPKMLQALLYDLEEFINNGSNSELDPLIKMAIIHHQFESIHPFYDGNGRIGRIINIIYLMQQGLLDIPILYLSRYINHNKDTYYHLLQTVRDKGAWQDWIVFMLRGVAKTAQNSLVLIKDIRGLQQEYKSKIRSNYAKIYSQGLINNIFKHPYTKVAFLQKDLNISRPTATRYLDRLAQGGLLSKHKLGRENYYLNDPLINLLTNIDTMKDEL